MEEYKPNSHRSKEERKESIPEKHVEKVISGTVKPKKKSEMQKFADVFISEDVNNVKSYIVMDVLVPAIKKAISDIVTNGIDMILYGEAGKSKKNSTASKVSYQKYYDGGKKDYAAPKSRTSYEYDELLFETRGDAESVLDAMNEIIAQYEVVSVADLYDLANVSNDNYAANMVSHPEHYMSKTGMEVIDVIEAFTDELKGVEATDTGNIIKYACRWKKKNGIQDLEKILWYTQHLIDHLKNIEEENKYEQSNFNGTLNKRS